MIIRPLEKVDLEFIYQQENTRNAMALWFEEPYSSFDELSLLYDKHILDQSERRFIVQEDDGTPVGVVEIMDICYIGLPRFRFISTALLRAMGMQQRQWLMVYVMGLTT